ncbi:hypothetical protein Pan216_16460 [Planctomycetes bacterium Pan216]|uniref:DUF1559 domain-containing protein n=1 Tax=Kolteria novifilia TaxID=2527975 RepID=A0A518B1E0_9BACT|nr:hypothetical protein Pan216_16460 [Planctomycetes bacterium Pan216]
MKRSTGKVRAGITIVEVAVIIGILVVLACVILPGIMTAKISSRTGQCLNNMRNVGTAMLAYVTTHNTFPASGVWDVADADGDGEITEADLIDPTTGWNFAHPPGALKPTDPPSDIGMRYSWVVPLLPYLDRSDIYERWNFDDPAAASYLHQSTYDYRTNSQRAAPILSEVGLKVLVSSDDITVLSGEGNISFVVNGGFSNHWLVDNEGTGLVGGDGDDLVAQRVRENRFRMGLFFLETSDGQSPIGRRHTLETIRDGTATTVMLSENINAGPGAADWTSNWACPHPWNTSFQVNGVAVGVDRTLPYEEYDYAQSNRPGPLAPPILANGKEGGINGSTDGVLEGQFPYPNSLHRGGVHVVFADGSTRLLSEAIDPSLWARIVTPDGQRLFVPETGGIEYAEQPVPEDDLSNSFD